MKRVSQREANEISELANRLGDRRFRTLMAPEGKRIVSKQRLANLSAGRGKLTETERQRLGDIETNSRAIQALGKKADKESPGRPYLGNRAIRTWLNHGKEKGVQRAAKGTSTRAGENEAIRALFFLGVEPSEGTYYVKRRK